MYTGVLCDFLRSKFQPNIRGSHHMQETNFVRVNNQDKAKANWFTNNFQLQKSKNFI